MGKPVIYRSCGSADDVEIVQCSKCQAYVEEPIMKECGCPGCGSFPTAPGESSFNVIEGPAHEPDGKPTGIAIM